jgi:zinc protease
MKRRFVAAGALSACLLASASGGAEQPAAPATQAQAPAKKTETPGPELPVKQYVLENGLTVLLSEDHVLPSVAVHITYLVGSGHEEKGKTGFAHLFEHLMFQGSANFDHEYFAPFEPIGARANGTTNSDRTVYYEQVPSQYAELPLWMESDRMRSLLPVLTQDKLDNQRDVVKNERRQRYEITPYGMAWWHLDNALYPLGHPYHHSTIGSHEDLSAATLEDVRAFFLKYYVPKNAALSVVGNFDENEMRALIEKYFGDIPGGQRAKTPAPAPPSIEKPKHWVAEDDIQLPRVYFAWVTPALFEEGDAELDLLSNILTQGKSSRLFHSLVYDKKLAKDVYAYQVSQKLNGMYVIQATAAPGTELETLAQELEKELEKALGATPSESELLRAKNDYKKSFFDGLQTYEARASHLGSYFLHVGKGDYIHEDYERYTAATASGVQNAGKKYLDFDHVVRIDFVPGKKSTPVRKLEEEKQQAPSDKKGASQ